MCAMPQSSRMIVTLRCRPHEQASIMQNRMARRFNPDRLRISVFIMRTSTLLLFSVLMVAPVHAQQNPLLGEDVVKVSDHVWAIMGFPNIAIVTGTRATLVVDT